MFQKGFSPFYSDISKIIEVKFCNRQKDGNKLFESIYKLKENEQETMLFQAPESCFHFLC